MNRHRWNLAWVVIPLACCGCGGGGAEKVDTVPVSGTVFLDDEPHGPASLMLVPIILDPASDIRPTVGGDVDASGKYTLTTYEKGDGAAPGEYTVQLRGPAGQVDTTDPQAMMGAMSGGTAVEELNISIPEDGSESLEIRLKSTNKRPAGGSSLLGS